MSDPTCEDAGMKQDVRAGRKQQLQFPLPTPRVPGTRPARPCSRERADWWFRQMRRVVEEGIDYRSPGVF